MSDPTDCREYCGLCMEKHYNCRGHTRDSYFPYQATACCAKPKKDGYCLRHRPELMKLRRRK